MEEKKGRCEEGARGWGEGGIRRMMGETYALTVAGHSKGVTGSSTVDVGMTSMVSARETERVDGSLATDHVWDEPRLGGSALLSRRHVRWRERGRRW